MSHGNISKPGQDKVESEKGDGDVFSRHVAGRFLRYFSFMRDEMSPGGPRSINLLLRQKNYYPVQSC